MGNKEINGSNEDQAEICLVYDGQCPVCRPYAKRVAVDDPDIALRLVDAREDSALMQEITARGLDIDHGMVVTLEGQLYYGAEAFRIMATRQGSGTLFNRLCRLLFANRHLAHLVYPLGKQVRVLLLRLIGLPPIDNLGHGRGWKGTVPQDAEALSSPGESPRA